MIVLWYLADDGTIQADVIIGGVVLYRTTHRFPSMGSRALFWLVISAMTREIYDEVAACSS